MDTTANDPRAASALQELEDFGAHFSYDVGYLRALAEGAPDAFLAFHGAMALSRRGSHLTAAAHAVATLAVMGVEDCGACSQLNLAMALEEGVARETLQTLLDDPASLPEPLADVFAHGRDVARGASPDPERVARLRWALGDTGFAQLAAAIVGARLYPGLKRALGVETSCRRPTLDI